MLYSFQGGSDGADPFNSVVADKQGNLYGVTYSGGSADDGTVFKLAPDGTKTTLHSFVGADGKNPTSLPRLALDKDGNLYGTTLSGGTSDQGTVFKITPEGNATTLYSFTGGNDGGQPYGGVILEKGNLYGTTSLGGMTNVGTVYEVTPAGAESVIYSFTGLDGADPEQALLSYRGQLCSTASSGGHYESGLVFCVKGGKEKILYTFTGSDDGNSPSGALIADKAGNLYSTTYGGGIYHNGVVFEIAKGGTESTLYNFKGGKSDGAEPWSIVMDDAGNIFGTTKEGGGRSGCILTSGCGTIYKLTPDGSETVLYEFGNGHNGAVPFEGPYLGANDTLYGTTFIGGGTDCYDDYNGKGCGVVFSINE